MPDLWQGNTGLTTESNKITLYSDTLADTPDIIEAQKAIKKSFPNLPAGFYDMLDDRIRASKFTAERLRDAVNYVIDNCIYPTPTIANFITFDRIVKIYTYEKVCHMAELFGPEMFETYPVVILPGCTAHVRVHKDDVLKFKLKTK